MDQRYVGFREHAATQQRLDAELARIRERQATTEATLLHEVTAVRSDLGELKQLLLRQPEKVDHGALSTHRALDILADRLGDSANNKTSPLLIAFALLGAVALGAFGMQLIGG